MNKRAIAQLDVETLYVALDKERRRRKLLWRPLARELGLAPSTFTRLGQGKLPSADALCTLVIWLNIPLHQVVCKERPKVQAVRGL